MHAPPIEMELRLLNKEFALLRSRRKITWEGQEIDPTQVALPMEKWTSHLAKTLHIQKAVCLSVAEAREMARRPGKHVYTEGAYSPNSAGAAYVAFGKGTSIAATGRFWVLDATSAYCTEVVALTEALQFLRTYNPDRPGYIYTDCLSVLQALANPQCLDPRIVHMRELIAEISLTRSFRISHVPGHKGIFGNELADFLAWRACRIGAVRQAHLSVRQVKSRLRHWLIDLWNSEWRQLHADTELARVANKRNGIKEDKLIRLMHAFVKTHAALISANTMYNKNGTRLGLSFEMGTLYYKLNETTESRE
ncbi:hypothetical protein HPB51_027468 [Rhipicephalus microplus]|uniref:RNase H type-1 domain-containing protein n=1 Tax=Rhipicephalus microplus TaxID=6941 RepID=A0A9J6D063_RHIMP|nr:hypothetical protein HPB51_027468 [Rhipicephalus microplus]